MGLYKGVFYQNSVLVRDEDFFFCQYHSADAERDFGNGFACELADVLVTVGAEDAVLILMQAEVERGAVLDHRFVERRQKHMRFIVHLRNRYHQKTMLLAGVAAHDGRAVVRSRHIRAKHLFGKRLLQVDHKVLVKFKITHDCRYMCWVVVMGLTRLEACTLAR